MRTLVVTGWATLVGSLVCMVIGHLGAGRLSWISDQISTYAAVAPHDGFITASIWMSACGLLIVGILVSKYRILGRNDLAHLVPSLCGAAAAGLVMLSYFKATARSLAALKHGGFWAIRVQSFHDAGLSMFFYSALLLVMLAGVLALIHYSRVLERILGGAIFGMGPVSYFLMTTKWPRDVGFSGIATGVNERAALFCLWLAVAMILRLASRAIHPGEAHAAGKKAGGKA